MNRGADVRDVLAAASTHGYDNVVIKLLEHGVDPNIVVTNEGDTALMLASLRGKSLVVKALLETKKGLARPRYNCTSRDQPPE